MKLVSWMDDPKVVQGAVLVFVISYLFFFPSFFASFDEHEYIQNAVRFSNGQLTESNPLNACAPYLHLPSSFQIGDPIPSTYFPGKSVLLIPFLPFGLTGLMLVGLIVHLVGAWLFYRLLKTFHYPSIFTLVYLFFPPLVYLARTQFTEALVGVLALGAILLYLKSDFKSLVGAGLLFGAACAVRYDALLLVIPFLVGALLFNRKKVIGLLVGFIPISILILLYNQLVFNNPIFTPYGNPTAISTRSLDFSLIGSNALYFLLILLVLFFPFILAKLSVLSQWLKNKKIVFPLLSFEIVAAFLLYFIFFSRFTNISVYPLFDPLTFTARIRNFVPVLMLLLLLVPFAFEQLRKQFITHERLIHQLLLVYLGVIIVGSMAIHALHAPLVNDRATLRDQIQANVPADAIMVGSSDDCIYSLDLTQSRSYLPFLPNEKLPPALQHRFPAVMQNYSQSFYFISIEYAHRKNRDSVRQSVVDQEREPLRQFIQENDSNLELVYSTTTPHDLNVYRWVGK